MAEISQIRLPNNTILDLKDAAVPEWAKQATKPTYTASEVGAAATNHTHTQLHAASPTGDGEVSVGVNLIALTASSNGGSTQNRMTLTSTATTIHNIVTPTENGDAANKKYVDDNTPAPESMSNVQAMLTELGLDSNASLTPATVPAETNHALVQEG